MKVTREQIKKMIMEKLKLSEGSGRAAPVGSPHWRQRDAPGHSASQKPRSERAEEFLYYVGIDVQTNSWEEAKEASVSLQRPILDAVGNPAEPPIEENTQRIFQITKEELEKILSEEDENLEEKDEKWIQDAEEDIEKRGTEGVCTGEKFGSESCPPGSKRYNLAKTFRKMPKKRKD